MVVLGVCCGCDWLSRASSGLAKTGALQLAPVLAGAPVKRVHVGVHLPQLLLLAEGQLSIVATTLLDAGEPVLDEGTPFRELGFQLLQALWIWRAHTGHSNFVGA